MLSFFRAKCFFRGARAYAIAIRKTWNQPWTLAGRAHIVTRTATSRDNRRRRHRHTTKRHTVTRQKDTPSHDKNININNKILGIILERNTVTRQKDTLSHDKNDEEKHTVTRQKTHHRKTKKHTDTRAKDHVTMARGKSSHDVFHEEEEPLIS